ncbi:MAG: gamma carbonic anhydrase family protein [Acidimicrobiia bacterium]|nr:gamma carbonic anhydrase family protein [Acidimicrobiia bacterium]
MDGDHLRAGPAVSPEIHPTAFVADTARITGSVEISELAVIMYGVVIRAEADRVSVGARTNVQDVSVLHCDAGIPCAVGDDTTIGHAAVVHGATVGDHCLVGIGARALNGSVLGEGAWLAAGSVLTEGKTIPDWTLAMGTPAKPVRDLTDDEVARQRSGIEEYLRIADIHRHGEEI